MFVHTSSFPNKQRWEDRFFQHTKRKQISPKGCNPSSLTHHSGLCHSLHLFFLISKQFTLLELLKNNFVPQ